MTEITLKVEGMSCMHCVGRVEKALTSLDGVESAKVSLEEKEAKVEYDPDKVDIEKMEDAIGEAGYSVVRD
jgi:copper ion binding protein